MGRTREVLDLLSMGKNISELMRRLSSEHMSTQQKSGKIVKMTLLPPICSTDIRINSAHVSLSDEPQGVSRFLSCCYTIRQISFTTVSICSGMAYGGDQQHEKPGPSLPDGICRLSLYLIPVIQILIFFHRPLRVETLFYIYPFSMYIYYFF